MWSSWLFGVLFCLGVSVYMKDGSRPLINFVDMVGREGAIFCVCPLHMVPSCGRTFVYHLYFVEGKQKTFQNVERLAI